jgi:hypothetical protein
MKLIEAQANYRLSVKFDDHDEAMSFREAFRAATPIGIPGLGNNLFIINTMRLYGPEVTEEENFFYLEVQQAEPIKYPS